jgi:1-phosphofructokinase
MNRMGDEVVIITVTLNPAIDKTMTIDNFQPGKVNRESSVRIDVGGKGINVSKTIQALGGESMAIGIMAGSAGEFIKRELGRMGIEHHFIGIEGETRTNIKIVDSMNGSVTDINENGPFLPIEILKEFEAAAMDHLTETSLVVFSGSVPRNVDKDIYRRLIHGAKAKGAKTILDADGELLLEGLKAGPYLVKPNIHELERLFSIQLDSTEKVIAYGRKLFDYGVEHVVVSLGEEGAIFINKEQTVLAKGIKVDVKSTVGAGDAMVAAMAVAMSRGYTLDEIIRWAVAASAANVMTEGTQAPSIDEVTRLMKEVEFIQIN